jgi:predicted sulfurtransferase
LKYFEETAGAHYTGNCFVFDDRAIVDTKLAQVGDYPPDTQFNPKLYNHTVK